MTILRRLLAAVASLWHRATVQRPAQPREFSSDRAELEHQLMEYRRELAEKAKRGTLS